LRMRRKGETSGHPSGLLKKSPGGASVIWKSESDGRDLFKIWKKEKKPGGGGLPRQNEKKTWGDEHQIERSIDEKMERGCMLRKRLHQKETTTLREASH